MFGGIAHIFRDGNSPKFRAAGSTDGFRRFDQHFRAPGRGKLAQICRVSGCVLCKLCEIFKRHGGGDSGAAKGWRPASTAALCMR